MEAQRTALVTGAASGVGAAIAERFPQAGYQVAFWTSMASPPTAPLHGLPSRLGGCTHVRVDGALTAFGH